MKYVLTFTLLIGLSPLWGQKKLPATEIKTLDGQTVNILDYVDGGLIQEDDGQAKLSRTDGTGRAVRT